MFLVPLMLLASMLHAGPERSLTSPRPNAAPESQFAGDFVAGDELALLTWSGPGIHAARFDREGRGLDLLELATASDGFLPIATRANDRWLVLWRNANELQGKFVHDDGSTSELVRIAPWPDVQELRVAFDGTQFLVAWRSFERLMAIRLDANARVLEAPFVIDATPVWTSMDVVALDSGFAVVAVRMLRDENLFTVNAYRLNADGDVVQHTGLDNTQEAIGSLHVIANGAQLIAVWSGNNRTFIAHEGEPLRVLNEPGYLTEDVFRIGGTTYVLLRGPRHLRVRSVDGSYARSWEFDFLSTTRATPLGDRMLLASTYRVPDAFDHDLWTSTVDATLQDVQPFTRVEFAPVVQEQPAIARNDRGELLAVWTESGDGAARVVAMLLNNAGQPLTRKPLILGTFTRPMTRPRVASDGTDFLVVWPSALARVSRNGAVTMSNAPVPVNFDSCLTFNGTHYVLGFNASVRLGGGGTTFEVRAASLTRDGALISQQTISPEGTMFALDCASTTNASLFTWSNFGRVEGAIVTSGGTAIAPFTIASTGVLPAVASNDDRFLVAWSAANTIERAIVTEAGTVSPITDVPLGSGNADATIEAVDVAPSRTGFLLGWGPNDLRAIALDRDGRAASPIFDIANTTPRERELSIAGGDTPIAIYMRELDRAGSWRVFTRTLTTNTPRVRAARH